MHQNESFQDFGFSASGDVEDENIFPQEMKIEELSMKIEALILQKIHPVIVGTFGTIGNLLIIIYFVKINLKKKLKNMSSYHFIINMLAVADLLACLGESVLSSYWSKQSWELGEFECRFLVDFASCVCPMASSWLLVFLSYVRYRSLVQPFKTRISKRKCGAVCFTIWLVSFVNCIYVFINRKLFFEMDYEGHLRLQCKIRTSTSNILAYDVSYMFLDSVFPVALMTHFYRKIKQKIDDDKTNSFELNPQSRQRNHTALKTIRSLIMVYIICVCPARIIYAFLHTVNIYAQREPLFHATLISYISVIRALTVFTYYFNNLLNVFVYAKMMTGFRQFLIHVLTFKFLHDCRRKKTE